MSEIIADTYELIDRIGAGGGGVVYLANHLRLNKKVVLKADKRKLTTRPDFLRREVDALKDLNHSYIPQVYDFFVDGETVYTVMDYIDGESLDKPLKRNEKFSQPQVIKWAQQLLEALRYLHSPTHGNPPRGFVHSDIKPANIMRTQQDNICLIDFNIALALGEENVVGRSDGYASPEHYGLDFSTNDGTATKADSTTTMVDATSTITQREESSSSSKRIVIPDMRSDIYSTGATLYHLLTGKKPATHATDIVPLSAEEFTPQIVNIITKAMQPNPDLRYQTAEEMLYAFTHLRENDPRTKRYKRSIVISTMILLVIFFVGGFTTFVGLKQMEQLQNAYVLAEYSGNALRAGDVASAIDYALRALPEKRDIFTPPNTAEAQKALTDALNVYDLTDGFKTHGSVELPSAPLFMEISPGGKTAACVYAYNVAVFDTDTAEIIVTLPAEPSALAEVKFVDDDIIVYAGEGGIKAYDISKKRELWSGKAATKIAVSADSKIVAAVYKDENTAVIYEVEGGRPSKIVPFGNRSQYVTVNDSFANPNDNIFALNQDGTLLAASFSDGSLTVFDLTDSENNIDIFDGSDFTHFDGGFHEQFFAFSAFDIEESLFAVIDTEKLEQTGGFDYVNPFRVQANESGIFVQTENILVNIHPVTGEQTALVTTFDKISQFAQSNSYTLITTKDEYMFFGKNANLISRHEKEYGSDFIQIAGSMAIIGSLDAPTIRIMKLENHSEADVFAYDPTYTHDEARISDDGRTVMLFSYDRFRLYSIDGEIIAEASIADAKNVYDQQYRRDENGSRLEVIYNDGTVLAFSAIDGSLLYETTGEKPDLTLNEEFFTDTLRIESQLHGAPRAYDKNSGKLIKELEKDSYLTYVTQLGEYIITEYITADGERYGMLLNQKCETLAYLPYLCDIIGDELIFDYPTGDLRKSRIYHINELIDIARER